MLSIPIVFLYQSKYYKGTVSKIPGVPVQYRLSAVDPPLFLISPIVFVSDPSEDRLIYNDSELDHAIAAAIVDSCHVLEEPLHA